MQGGEGGEGGGGEGSKMRTSHVVKMFGNCSSDDVMPHKEEEQVEMFKCR